MEIESFCVMLIMCLCRIINNKIKNNRMYLFEWRLLKYENLVYIYLEIIFDCYDDMKILY